jgi:hypothetical protein
MNSFFAFTEVKLRRKKSFRNIVLQMNLCAINKKERNSLVRKFDCHRYLNFEFRLVSRFVHTASNSLILCSS